jgi:hypothetical protein
VPSPFAHRCWTIAYFASWVLATSGACWIAVALGWAACGDAGIDDDIGLLGIPLGAVAGFLAARATRQRRRVHRVLVVVGPLIAAIGAAGAVVMFAAARARRGEGFLAGLGEAIVAFVGLAVTVIGVLWLAAGAAGLLAARAAPGDGASHLRP